MYQTNIQSHKMSMLSLFRYSTRKGGAKHQEGIVKLTDELDAIIETEEDQLQYGVNTEFDALDFSQEMFGRFYGSADKESNNEWSFAHEELDKLDEIRQLQDITHHDPDLSLLSTNYVLDEMSESIALLLQEYRAYMDDPDNQDENGDVDPSNFSPSGDTQVAMQQAAGKLGDAIEELKNAKPLIEAMSGDQAATEKGETDRSQMVKELLDPDSTLRKIMKIVGRLQNAISGLQANSLAQEMTDQEITTGKAKFSHLVSNEKMYLADDATVDKFYSRHINREQFMFRQKGKNKKVGGPITVLVDESSSMSGSREDIAKATAAALFIMATEQKRDATVIGFGSRVNYTIKKKKGEKISYLRWERGNPNTMPLTYMKSIEHIANRNSRGGTNFAPAIEKALDESKGRNADILFITDGQDRISSSSLSAIQKSKAKNGTRIFTIVIGTRNECLESVSDAILPFSYLNDDTINSLARLIKTMER